MRVLLNCARIRRYLNHSYVFTKCTLNEISKKKKKPREITIA